MPREVVRFYDGPGQYHLDIGWGSHDTGEVRISMKCTETDNLVCQLFDYPELIDEFTDRLVDAGIIWESDESDESKIAVTRERQRERAKKIIDVLSQTGRPIEGLTMYTGDRRSMNYLIRKLKDARNGAMGKDE